MKIGKIFSFPLSVLFALSCFSVSGMEKNKYGDCLNCGRQLFSRHVTNPPFFGCTLKNKFEMCRKCFMQFNSFNGAYLIRPYGKHFEELLIMGSCFLCRGEYDDIRKLMNSDLSHRVKSFIYKFIKFHDQQKETKIAEALHNANPRYFDFLDSISLLSDDTVEVGMFYPTIKNQIFKVVKQCAICYTDQTLNQVPICANNHKNVICKVCLSQIVKNSQHNSCPFCRSQITNFKPLPDNFTFNG